MNDLQQRLLTDGERRKLCQRLIAQERFAAAIKTTNSIVDKMQRALALAEIAFAEAKVGEQEAAWTTFASAVDAAKQISPERDLRAVLAGIAIAQAHAGDVKEAFKTTRHIGETVSVQAPALHVIAVIQAKAGDEAGAAETRSRFIQDRLSQVSISTAHIESINYESQGEEFVDALEVAQGIEHERGRKATANEIKAELLPVKKEFTTAVDDLFQTVAEIENNAHVAAGSINIPSEVYWASQMYDEEENKLRALVVKAHPGNPVDAIEALRTTEWNYLSKAKLASALKDIGVAQAKAGEVEAARVAFKAAVEMALSNTFESERRSSLKEIAFEQAQAGDVKGARPHFALAVEQAHLLGSETKRASALLGISIDRARAGDTTGALETAQSIEAEEHRASALKQVAVALVNARFSEQAVHMVDAILVKREQFLLEVANALADAEEKEQFKRLLIPCAYYPDATHRMCGLLERLYPEQAKFIKKAVSVSV